MTEPFAHTSGPRRARVVICGEAFGEAEEANGKPFVGQSGQELWRMLGEAWPEIAPTSHRTAKSAFRSERVWLSLRETWLEEASVLLTNVLAFRPPGNKIDALCCPKKDLPDGYNMPAISQGKYLRPEFLSEIFRLHNEIEEAQPNLIIAMGNTACWALLKATNIGSIRGAISQAHLLSSKSGQICRYKILPTYHPAGVLRNWSWRTIVIADLIKALREAQFPEVRRPNRVVLTDPTFEEVLQFIDHTLAYPPAILGVDTETKIKQIEIVGFSISRDKAIAIPFIDTRFPGASYWPTAETEFTIWRAIKRLLESPVPKLLQNGLFDLQFFIRHGIFPRAFEQDSMLLHHAMFPELQKGLGFLGSIYSSEISWKLMARHRADETIKRDE